MSLLHFITSVGGRLSETFAKEENKRIYRQSFLNLKIKYL